MTLLEQFDRLIDHLNAREDSVVELFRDLLETHLEEASENAAWVYALEAAGVDNWEGYDDAREIFQESE